ncbi:unnamed protein product [Arctia plantaginis]|uniref:Transport and Golgi organization protein 2 n=1 Tax=Arctia plantaginis TaxID=874455 RepID=A0A8S0YRM8_ARCPL|nr:unnamed protein product [Arctia plantaginis]
MVNAAVYKSFKWSSIYTGTTPHPAHTYRYSNKKMCILFIYNGSGDPQSDYSLILISNRDEYYDRPTQNMTIWSEDPVIVGGRDLEIHDGGTWLAVSPTYKKIGVLLNLPGASKENAKTRGKIVVDYVKSKESVQEYIENTKNYIKNCNEFVLVAIEFNNVTPSIFSYSNANDQLLSHKTAYNGFGNNLPETPLKKVEVGRSQLEHICSKFNKESMEKELIENLLQLLKSDQRHLPDQQLEAKRPNIYEELSSIYVCIPKGRYGTRTHTIVLLKKTGHLSITEITQRMPIDPASPTWDRSEFNFEINVNSCKCTK